MDDSTNTGSQQFQQPSGLPDPAGSMHKEIDMPVVRHSEQIEMIPEHERPVDVPAPVEVVSNRVDVPPDIARIGVTNAPQDQTIVQTTQGALPTLPLTDDQIGQGLSQKPKSSFRWLAEWCLRQLRKLHFTIQKVQGHFIRVRET